MPKNIYYARSFYFLQWTEQKLQLTTNLLVLQLHFLASHYQCKFKWIFCPTFSKINFSINIQYKKYKNNIVESLSKWPFFKPWHSDFEQKLQSSAKSLTSTSLPCFTQHRSKFFTPTFLRINLFINIY